MAAPFGPRFALPAALSAALRGGHPCGVGFCERIADGPYPSGEPHLPFQVKPLSSVLMDDLKVAHKYGGDDGA